MSLPITSSYRIVSISANTGSSKRLIYAVNRSGKLWKLFVRGDHPIFAKVRYKTEIEVPVKLDQLPVLAGEIAHATEDWSQLPAFEVDGDSNNPIQIVVDSTVRILWTDTPSNIINTEDFKTA